MKNYKAIFMVFIILICTLALTTCGKFNIFIFGSDKYSGDINLNKYTWIAGKKIFVDPGHGGKGSSDRLRIGQDGITEEEINLRVALILEDMLERAGAIVSLSRHKDRDVPLIERVEAAVKFQPDLLISLHHNGSLRPMDSINYPAVLIWGNRKVGPASFDFAEILLDEFQRIMDKKGIVVSDFSLYKETGTMILRETRYLCPGVIGEPGFFSDSEYAGRLNDMQYNQEEAEAYFYAIGAFFKRGIPGAEVMISCPVDNESYLNNLIRDKSPVIAIKVDSGLERAGIIKESLNVTFDDIKVNCRPVADDLFFVEYGSRLYPGGHAIKFSFRNQLNQSSMVYTAGFTMEIKKGDYDALTADGIKYLANKTKRKEGLKMLLSALSMGITDPGSDKIIWHIAKGFDLIGDRVNSEYYFSRLYHFYPQSKLVKNLESGFRGYRFPVEYNGKWIDIKYESSLKDDSRK